MPGLTVKDIEHIKDAFLIVFKEAYRNDVAQSQDTNSQLRPVWEGRLKEYNGADDYTHWNADDLVKIHDSKYAAYYQQLENLADYARGIVPDAFKNEPKPSPSQMQALKTAAIKALQDIGPLGISPQNGTQTYIGLDAHLKILLDARATVNTTLDQRIAKLNTSFENGLTQLKNKGAITAADYDKALGLHKKLDDMAANDPARAQAVTEAVEFDQKLIGDNKDNILKAVGAPFYNALLSVSTELYKKIQERSLGQFFTSANVKGLNQETANMALNARHEEIILNDDHSLKSPDPKALAKNIVANLKSGVTLAA